MHTGNQIALLWFELPGFSSNSLLCMRFWRLTKAVFYSAKTSGVFVGHLRALHFHVLIRFLRFLHTFQRE